ncbi:MAG: VWA domain-containing protein [Phycisphaerae bacterium]|nr:VWA domain-containing protein [Phycisphaerae bacterium]
MIEEYVKTNDPDVNRDPRVPLVLLLDTSSSMEGEKIAQLNAGLHVLRDALMEDPYAQRRVDLAIVTFGGTVATATPFTMAPEFDPPMLSAAGNTPMGTAILQGIDIALGRLAYYQNHKLPKAFVPWVFLITDGEPTDSYERAAARVRQLDSGERPQLQFFAVGVDGANMRKLAEISRRPPVMLNGVNFRDFFLWLTISLSRVSQTQTGVSIQTPAVTFGTVYA